MNLGAGRVVFQELGRINKAARELVFEHDPTIQSAFQYEQAHHKKVHFMGLLSAGGVHAHINHLMALCDAAKTS